MNKESIISVFLALLILVSVVAMYWGGGIDNNDDFYNPEIEEGDIENYLGNIDARIASTIPEIIIASETEEFDATKIENDFLEMEGVKRTVVEYNKLDDDSIIVIIRLSVDEEKIESIVNKTNQLEYLLSEPIEFYKQGILDLNEKIILESANDENKTIEYQFVDYRVEGIIGIETIKEDLVTGQLQATFIGNNPQNIVFFEVSNKTAEPKFLIDQVTLEIKEWKEEYLYTGKSDYFTEISQEEIKDSIKRDNLEITIEKNPVIAYLSDLNLSIEDFDQNYFVDIYKNEDETIILLDENITYQDYNLAKEILEEKGFEKENITEDIAKNYYIISIEENIIDIEEKLKEININLKETNKKAIINAEEIIIENESYFYPEKEHEKWILYPDYIDFEELDFSIQAYVSRNEILFLGLEVKE